MTEKFAHNLYVVAVLIGGLLVITPLSVAYYYGNLSTYTDSYFIASVGRENHTPGSIWMVTLYSSMFSVGMATSGFMSYSMSPRLTLLFGMICFNLGIYTSYFTLRSSFWSLHITLGVLTGIGAGIAYSSTLLYVATWGKKRVGLFTAIVSSAACGGSSIFNLVITLFINPKNFEADIKVGESMYFSQDEILNHVPYVLLVLGAITTGFHAIALPLMRNHPDFVKMRRKKSSNNIELNENSGLNGFTSNITQEWQSQGETAIYNQHKEQACDKTIINENSETNISNEETRSEITPLQALKTKPFYLLALSHGCLMSGLLIVTNSYKQFGVLYISDDIFLANIGVGTNVAATVIRIIWGLAVDKFNAKTLLVLIPSSHVILSALWYFSPLVDKWFYLVWTLLLQSNLYGIFVLHPIIILKLFGYGHYTTIYGMVEFLGICFLLAMQPLGHVILTELGWFWFFLFTSGVGFISLLANICIPKVP